MAPATGRPSDEVTRPVTVAEAFAAAVASARDRRARRIRIRPFRQHDGGTGSDDTLAIPHEEAHPFHLAYPPALRDWPPLVAFREWLREEIDLSHKELHATASADRSKPKRIRSGGRSRTRRR